MTPALSQVVAEPAAVHLQRGKQAEEHSAGERENQSEAEHGAVYRDLLHARHREARGKHAYERGDSPPGKQKSEGSSSYGEEQALDRELMQQAPAAGAESNANRHLAAPGGGAHQ